MNAALIKTALASLAAAVAANSAAFAGDTDVLNNVREQIADHQDKILAVVMKTSDERINKMQETKDDNDNLNLAENDAQPAS